MKPYILIVDDDQLILELYSDYFTQNGFRVSTAASASEALQIIRSDTPNIVLADVIMPQESGFDLYEKAQLSNPELPFIFMTGYEHDNKVIKRLKELQCKWLSKPISMDELIALARAEMKSDE